jgi:hypothetical protein
VIVSGIADTKRCPNQPLYEINSLEIINAFAPASSVLWLTGFLVGTVENGLLGQPNLKVIAIRKHGWDCLRASGIFCGHCSRAASGCDETRTGCWRSNAVFRREFRQD